MEPMQETINQLVGGIVPQLADEIQGALYILEGQYLYCWREDRQTRFKAVSPSMVRSAFNQEPIDTGWLPSSVIRTGSNHRGDWVVEFVVAKTYTLNLGSAVVTVPLPSFVFLGAGTRYFLWAVPGKTFKPDAIAYHAPLPNISLNGELCFGTNTPPSASPATIAQARTLFFEAEFNSHQEDNKSRLHPESVRTQLRELAMQNRRTYPLRDLIRTNKTINATVEAINARQSLHL